MNVYPDRPILKPERMKRMTAFRKRRVIESYRLSADVSDWLRENGVSQDEFQGWLEDFREFGLAGLNVTKAQVLREKRANTSL